MTMSPECRRHASEKHKQDKDYRHSVFIVETPRYQSRNSFPQSTCVLGDSSRVSEARKIMWFLRYPSPDHLCWTCRKAPSAGLGQPGRPLTDIAARQVAAGTAWSGGGIPTKEGTTAEPHHKPWPTSCLAVGKNIKWGPRCPRSGWLVSNFY